MSNSPLMTKFISNCSVAMIIVPTNYPLTSSVRQEGQLDFRRLL